MGLGSGLPSTAVVVNIIVKGVIILSRGLLGVVRKELWIP